MRRWILLLLFLMGVALLLPACEAPVGLRIIGADQPAEDEDDEEEPPGPGGEQPPGPPGAG